MPSIHARVAEGWRRSRMMRGIRKNAKTYPAMLKRQDHVLPDARNCRHLLAFQGDIPAMLEGAPSARYNTAFPMRRGTEVAVTGSTRNRLGGASRHVGSNPTPSAIFTYSVGIGWDSNASLPPTG